VRSEMQRTFVERKLEDVLAASPAD
jgi:hypothetical protein